MKQHKAYKFRIYPTKKQANVINQTIGCTRFVFNYFLGKQKEEDAYWYIAEEMVQNGQLSTNTWKGSFFDKYASIKAVRKLKQHYPFLKEVDSISLQKSVENLSEAYTRYYKRQAKMPRFKSKRNKTQTYTTKQINGNIAVFDRHIKLPKLGFVKFAKSRDVDGRIINATIRRNPSGKYFVSLLAEVEIEEMPKTNATCGIDMGLKDFAVVSDGTVYENPKWLYQAEEKLSKAQRILSRRIKGSSNWQKQRIKVARIHEHITNARKDYLDKLSTQLVKSHDMIGIEDLSIASLLQNKQLAKSISDVSWYQFRKQLEYKATWYGKQMIVVAKNFASSQLCSVCGYKYKAVKSLAIREWSCPTCNTHHNRDVNASINIQHEAIKLLTVGTTEIA